MLGLDHKEGWAPKNWYLWIVVLEKTLESPLDCREIKPVNPPWIFIGRTDAEAEALVLWPPDVKNWLIWKDPDAGKDWRGRRRGPQRMRWHHQLNEHEFEQDPAVGDRQGSLVCCSPLGCKESDMTEWLNWLTLKEKESFRKVQDYPFAGFIAGQGELFLMGSVVDAFL